jgi:hypothetical protein
MEKIVLKNKIPNIIKEIRNNPPTEVNYAFQKNISYSQMSIFRGCPHRWKLQYKDKIKRFNSSIHTVFGTAIHETIQTYLGLMYNVSTVVADPFVPPANHKVPFHAILFADWKKILLVDFQM